MRRSHNNRRKRLMDAVCDETLRCSRPDSPVSLSSRSSEKWLNGFVPVSTQPPQESQPSQVELRIHTPPRGNSARVGASYGADPSKWVLAVKQPSTTGATNGRTTSSDTPEGLPGKLTPSEKLESKRRRSTLEAQLPLEERISLSELKSLMQAFQPCPADPTEPVNLQPPSTGQGDLCDGTSALHAIRGKAKCQWKGAGTGCRISATVERPRQLQQANTDVRPHSAQAILAAQRHFPVQLSQGSPPQNLRNLSHAEFIDAFQRVVPSATLLEIRALLSKAVPEAQETVSWNDVSTFLITRSQQKDDLVLENERFVLSSQHSSVRLEDQHSGTITCFAVEPVRRLVVTGCSEGSVRAWNNGGDLLYRGLLFQGDKWIVGLHWGCKGHVLYVITMNCWVYVLDGVDFKVLRVFHGRGIDHSPVSVTYARETISTVHLGGLVPSQRAILGARNYRGARLSLPQASVTTRKESTNAPLTPRRITSAQDSEDMRRRRLLSEAMQVRRAVHQAAPQEESSPPTLPYDDAKTHVRAPDKAASCENSSDAASPLKGRFRNTCSSHTTVYSLTTSAAAEALHQAQTLLTGADRGPYVHQQVEEGVLAGVVDGVTATAFLESALKEDVLLLGTDSGDVFLFHMAKKHVLTTSKVLVAHHVFRQLHSAGITQLELLPLSEALVSSGHDGHVRMTSLLTGKQQRSFYLAGSAEQRTSVTCFSLCHKSRLLLTIGPERYALVWEWSQLMPLAKLGPTRSPCVSGTFMEERVLILTRDGVLHVYDCRGFHLQQELSLASVGSLDRRGNLDGASEHAIMQLHADASRQQLLCFHRYPFSICLKRQVSLGCPERYHGHHSPVVMTLFSQTFGQVVTVGSDGVIMLWTPRTGRNEFSFVLSSFSYTNTATALVQPTAAALDIAHRRLVTGFAGGIVVVWNLLNGQAQRVLTAAQHRTSSSPAAVQSDGPRGKACGSRADGSGKQGEARAPGKLVSPKRDVTAVGSFARERSVAYIFAIGSRLFVDAAIGTSTPAERDKGPQLGEYSTTPASAWIVPPIYGDVTTLLQLAPHLIGCATTCGAVLLYNVLSECQEGAALWVCESVLSPGGMGCAPASSFPAANGLGTSRNDINLATTCTGAAFRCGGRPPLASQTNGNAAGTVHGLCQPPSAGMPGSRSIVNGFGDAGASELVTADVPSVTGAAATTKVTSHVCRMASLAGVHPRLLMVGQEDGTVSFWHTLHRVCLCAVSLTTTAQTVEEGPSASKDAFRIHTLGEPFVRMDVDEIAGNLLVYGDSEGNVHVCRMAWQMLSSPREQARALSMPNMGLYSVTAPLQEGNSLASLTPTTVVAVEMKDDERSLPVLSQFDRVHVFASGMILADVRIIHVDDAAPSNVTVDTCTSENNNGHSEELPAKGDDAASPRQPKTLPGKGNPRQLIFCAGVDHFVRVFTLAGVPIGELGMDEWNIAKPSTFRYMGEPTVPPSVPLPCSMTGNVHWQEADQEAIVRSRCYHDYLMELLTAHRTRHLPRGGSAGEWPRCSSWGQASSGSLLCLSGRTGRLDASVRMAARSAARSPSPSSDPLNKVHVFCTETAPNNQAFDLPDRGNAGGVTREGNPVNGEGIADEMPESGTNPGSSTYGLVSKPDSPVERCLSTRLHRNTRYRYDTDRKYHGVVRRSQAHFLPNRCPRRRSSLEILPQVTVGTTSDTGSAPHAPLKDTSTAHLAAEEAWSLSLSIGSRRSYCSDRSPGKQPQVNRLDTSAESLVAASDGSAGTDGEVPDTHPFEVTKGGTGEDADYSSARGDTSITSTDEPAAANKDVSAPHALPIVISASKTEPVSVVLEPLDLPSAGGPSVLSSQGTLLITGSLLVQRQRSLVATSSMGQALSATQRVQPPWAATTTLRNCGNDTSESDKAGTIVKRGSFLKQSPPFSAEAPVHPQSKAPLARTPSLHAFLSHERARLLESTHTTAAREHVASLAVPVLKRPVAAVVSVREASSAASSSQSSTFPSALPSLDISSSVDSVLERRRSHHWGGVPAAGTGMADSAEGYLAQVTSRMHVTPVAAIASPATASHGRPFSNAPAASRVVKARPH